MSQPVGCVVPVNSTHEWKITNFSSYGDFGRGKSINSPIFHTLCQDARNQNETAILQWRLGIYPDGHTNNDTDNSKFVSICLGSCNNFEVEIKYSLGIVGVNGHNIITKSNFDGKVFKTNGASWGWEFAEKETVLSKYSGLLINDTLTISCRIFGAKININSEIEFRGNSEALDFFEKLMLSGDLSDVTFIVGEKKMGLHKNILSSVSPIFRTMFKEETEKNVVNVEGVGANVMTELFRYVYAKKVKEIEKIAVELFSAAEKYCVKDLSVLCEETLCANLCMNTAFDLLEVAVRLNMKIVKEKVMNFIMANLSELVKKNEFNNLSPDVKDELLRYVASKERKRY